MGGGITSPWLCRWEKQREIKAEHAKASFVFEGRGHIKTLAGTPVLDMAGQVHEARGNALEKANVPTDIEEQLSKEIQKTVMAQAQLDSENKDALRLAALCKRHERLSVTWKVLCGCGAGALVFGPYSPWLGLALLGGSAMVKAAVPIEPTLSEILRPSFAASISRSGVNRHKERADRLAFRLGRFKEIWGAEREHLPVRGDIRAYKEAAIARRASLVPLPLP